jgi:hypothetical protein
MIQKASQFSQDDGVAAASAKLKGAEEGLAY